MAKSPSEKIVELAQQVATHFPLFEYRLEELKEDVEQLEQRVQQLETNQNTSNQRITAVEQRSSSLEKTSDRGWQLWLAALGFGFGLISLLITAALQLKK
ncbi:MAG: hypothetical protein L0241_25200 [Planctomycetia bacterium]|nr:hypothetical protein [Planctomycetia bacterium]